MLPPSGGGLILKTHFMLGQELIGGEISQDTAALPDTPLSGIIKKKDLEPKEETNNIPKKKLYHRKGAPGGAEGKTAAIELMAPYKVDGYGNNKGQKHCIYYQYGRSGVDTED